MVRQDLADVILIILGGRRLGRVAQAGGSAVEGGFILEFAEFGVARIRLDGVVAIGRRVQKAVLRRFRGVGLVLGGINHRRSRRVDSHAVDIHGGLKNGGREKTSGGLKQG